MECHNATRLRFGTGFGTSVMSTPLAVMCVAQGERHQLAETFLDHDESAHIAKIMAAQVPPPHPQRLPRFHSVLTAPSECA